MTRRGRKRRLVLEDEYWKLILGGVPAVAACRQIGIGRKTGYRWRAEAGGLGGRRRRSPGSCAGISSRMTRVSTTLTFAHARARDNARRERAGTLVVDPELRALVAEKLEDTWSPQQISAWLRAEYPDRPEWHICVKRYIRHCIWAARVG